MLALPALARSLSARSVTHYACAAGWAVLAFVAVQAGAPRPARLEVGAFHAGFLRGPWSRPERAEVSADAAPDGRTAFPFRRLTGPGGLALPVAARGPLRLALRCTTPTRSAVGVFVSGRQAGEFLVAPGVWETHVVEVPAALAGRLGLDIGLAIRPLALVRGTHAERGELFVDAVEVSAEHGVGAALPMALAVAAVSLASALLALASGARPSIVNAAAFLGAALAVALVWSAVALPFLLAVPRLLFPALFAGFVAAAALSRRADLAAADRAGLVALVCAGVLFHGSLVFLPRYNPNDLEIQVHRTLDLALVPWDYSAVLRYGSHLPTPTQPYGGADFALGQGFLVPYSPFPYLFFYALSRAGLDIYWSMTLLTVMMAMLVAPLLWLAAARIWDRRAAWTAVLLYALDLAVWHHVARARTPAAFGGALGSAALLFLAWRAADMGGRRVAVAGGLLFATALLAYASLPVLMGLFVVVLLPLLALDARAVPAASRRGLAQALVLGGLAAGALFYFHYVPGLLSGAGPLEAAPDPVRVYTFFIFHNEGRPNLRLWYEGYWVGLLAGLLAAPWALRRAAPWARPVLVSWLAAWGLVMLFKEPFFLPKLLRWAKEDQFLSPLLCLLIGAGIGALPRPWMRWTAAAVAVGTYAVLQGRDFFLVATGRVIL